jgi:hypothetical protein
MRGFYILILQKKPPPKPETGIGRGRIIEIEISISTLDKAGIDPSAQQPGGKPQPTSLRP